MNTINLNSLPPNHPLRFRGQNNDIDIKTKVINYVQNKLDILAQAKGYDNILSACTYVNSTIPKFAQEANEFIILRDNAWNTCITILNDVISGARPNITFEEIISELNL